jgi:hypothetical protein
MEKIRNAQATEFWSGKLKGEDIVEDIGMDGRMILKEMIQNGRV